MPGFLHMPAYLGLRTLVAAVGSVPPSQVLPVAASLARSYAGSTFNRKRLARAEGNLAIAFPEWSAEKRRDYAIRSWEHLVVLGAEILYTPRMLTEDSWGEYVSLGEMEPALRTLIECRPCLLLTAHCGNWEVLGHTVGLLGFPIHALYRPLDLPPLDRWVRRTRQRRGMMLVDKFGALRQLPQLVEKGAPLAFVADQNAGDGGAFVPFFNRLTSTYKSIGLLAMRFNATVACGVARRQSAEELAQSGRCRQGERGGMRYRMELIDVFGPEDWASQPDPLFYLTARYRRAIEVMVRRAPDQYLWMHRVWRSRPRHERMGKPFPAALLERLRALPWLTEDDIEAIRDQSSRDARTLAETGLHRLS